MAFVRLARLAELFDGSMRTYRIGGESFLLLQDEGKFYLIRNVCPHLGFPLHSGSFNRGILRCAYHGMAFDIKKNGRCVQHPQDALTLYPLVYEGDSLGVDI